MNKLIILIVLFFMARAQAHPVIYQGGWVLSTDNMESFSGNQAMYSFSHRWSAGSNYWRLGIEEEEREVALLKLNHLLYRYNGENSQGNIYLHGGYGLADGNSAFNRTDAYLGGIEADWETRQIYTAAKYYHFNMAGKQDVRMYQGRIGFSPMLAKFEDLQSWVMLQGMVISDIEPKLMLTPMVRFFYHNILWEMGASVKGSWMLNLMVHY